MPRRQKKVDSSYFETFLNKVDENNHLIGFLLFLMQFGMLWSKERQSYLKWFPWEMQKTVCMNFARYKINWIMKARQLGISELMALYAVYVAVTEKRSEIIIVSVDLGEAKYFLKERVVTKLESMYPLQSDAGVRFPWPNYVQLEDRIKWDNGSYIQAASSDNKEIISHTPRLVLFDEVRTYRWNDAAELWMNMLPSINDQPRSQLIAVSTAKPGTWFNANTEDIISGKVVGPHYFFMPFNANPKRDAKWVETKKALAGDDKRFYREYPRNEEDCFNTMEGMVYSTFDPEKHVRPISPNFKMKYIVCYDHGFRHPSVMLFMLYDKFTDHLYVFDEVFLQEVEINEVAFLIRKKMNEYRQAFNAPKPQLAIADTACFAKTGHRQTISEVLRRSIGLYFKKSDKHDRDGAVMLLKARFAYNGITIDPLCKHTIRQVSHLRWKNYEDYDPEKKTHDKEYREKPMDIDNDCTDCLEYTVSELHATPKNLRKEGPLSLKETLDRQVRRNKFSDRLRMGNIAPDFKGIEDFTEKQLAEWEIL